MQCAACGRLVLGQGYGFQLGSRIIPKCLSCGEWTEQEKRQFVQLMAAQMPSPTLGKRPCGCSGKR